MLGHTQGNKKTTKQVLQSKTILIHHTSKRW